MTLDVDAVATMALALGMPEMVEAGAKQVGQRRERADMPAQITAIHRMVAIRLDHHRHGVPAHVGAQALFDFEVARTTLLLIRLQGVHVTGVGRKRHVDAVLARVFEQLLKQEMRTLRPRTLDHRGQRVHPLAGFLCVVIVGGRTEKILGNGSHVGLLGFCGSFLLYGNYSTESSTFQITHL